MTKEKTRNLARAMAERTMSNENDCSIVGEEDKGTQSYPATNAPGSSLETQMHTPSSSAPMTKETQIGKSRKQPRAGQRIRPSLPREHNAKGNEQILRSKPINQASFKVKKENEGGKYQRHFLF